jgi:hypothetical protein
LHTIFSGDQFQFPPIGDDPLYKRCKVEELNKYNMTFNSKTKQRLINTTFGRWLWLQKTHCVILTEPMRQQLDHEYANLLERVKYGKCTLEDYNLLQTRIYNNPAYRKNIIPSNFDNSRIILSRNSIRAQTNIIMINDYCKTHNKAKIINISNDSWINKGKESNYAIDLLIKYRLRCIEESKSEKLCYKLDLVVGCNYILTKNIATPIGLTNNTYVRLEKIVTLEQPNETNCTTLTIVCLLVSKINKSTTIERNLFTNLEKDIYPIFPFTSYFNLSVPGISVTNKLNKNKNTINIRRTQFPMMLAFAVTCNNQQGSTVDSGIIDLSRPLDGHLQEAYTNVGLSRFRCLKDMTIIDEFDIEVIQQEPNIDLLIEELNYKKLANKTLEEYYVNQQEYILQKDHLSLRAYVNQKNNYFMIDKELEILADKPTYKCNKYQKTHQNVA